MKAQMEQYEKLIYDLEKDTQMQEIANNKLKNEKDVL
jgi:hypothetical protein